MSSSDENSDLDILLQTIMERIQMPLLTHHHSGDPLFQSDNLSFNDDDNNNNDDQYNHDKPNPKRIQISIEESKLEKEIIRTILTGDTDYLKPNSGQDVTIGDHHICVGYHHDNTSDYRIWEWHGHIMLIDEINGYTPEYIYGNYIDKMAFRSIHVKSSVLDEKKAHESEEKTGGLGLKGLIGSINSCSGRILHAGSQRNKM